MTVTKASDPYVVLWKTSEFDPPAAAEAVAEMPVSSFELLIAVATSDIEVPDAKLNISLPYVPRICSVVAPSNVPFSTPEPSVPAPTALISAISDGVTTCKLT